MKNMPRRIAWKWVRCHQWLGRVGPLAADHVQRLRRPAYFYQGKVLGLVWCMLGPTVVIICRLHSPIAVDPEMLSFRIIASFILN